jgi:hypothetical protein
MTCNGTGMCLDQSGLKLFNCEKNCEPIKCPNFELCAALFPECIGFCQQNRCVNCDIFWGDKNLEFIDNPEFDCSVCLEYKNKHIKFPGCCKHSVCIDCFKKLNFINESESCLNPILYGCPPCTNGCINPDEGMFCNCYEFDGILEKWINDFPEQSDKWSNDENNKFKDMEFRINQTRGKCVLCRANDPEPNCRNSIL